MKRKKKRLVLYLAVLLLLLLVITNPTNNQFENWAKKELADDGKIEGFGKQLYVDAQFESVLDRKNYILFSVYKGKAKKLGNPINF
ncbi:hypothetical protein JOC77_004237 [Peribacillus deserti]|uniref:DUF4359 domain-containing protein n=1 Tax=Peribacillus deserti TaxID=673318 RepID=A0ABS2QNM0_9BACI|nr:hypothetical protein [Peribacillus deserti]MBM7694760.1 hypothetical protein [Peribacillus deserti]